MVEDRIARIVKLTSIVDPNATTYVIQGELMKNLLDSVFKSRQAVYVTEPITTKEFIEEFKELFVGSKIEQTTGVNKDMSYQPTQWKGDISMLRAIMLDHRILDLDKKVEYLDRIIDKSTFPELVEAAARLKVEVQEDK